MIEYLVNFVISIAIMVFIMGAAKLFAKENDTYIGVGGIWVVILIIVTLFNGASLFLKIFDILMIFVKFGIASKIVEFFITNKASDHNDVDINRGDSAQRHDSFSRPNDSGPQNGANKSRSSTIKTGQPNWSHNDSNNGTKTTRPKEQDVFIYNQTVEEKQPTKMVAPDFSNRFVTVALGDTEYSNLLKLYKNYGASHTNLIKFTKQRIMYAGKLIKQLTDTDIDYPVAEFNAFKNDFYNKLDYSGNNISFWSFYKNQMNGDKGERLIFDYLKRDSGLEPLSNINMPCLYLRNDRQKPYRDSTQIDVILVCKYGIFAFESKNYDADAISIESNGKTETVWDSFKQQPMEIDQQFIRTYKNGKVNDNDSANMIGHQTYIHKQALIEYLNQDPNVSLNRGKLSYIVHSLFVYANPDIDKNNINKATGKKFFMGNQSQANRLKWKVQGIAAANCWNWVITHNNNDNLTDAQIKEVIESLKRYNQATNEKTYNHMIFRPTGTNDLDALDDYKAFLEDWINYDKHIKKQLDA